MSVESRSITFSMKKFLATLAIVLLGTLSIVGIAEAARTASQSVGGYFTTSPINAVNVYYNSGSVGIGTSAPTSNGLSVVGLATTSGADIVKIASSSGALYLTVGDTGTTTLKQYIGFGKPTLATSTGSGSNMGTATLAVGSTDLAGQIVLVTGSIPAANTAILTLTYGSSTFPFCIYSPVNKPASQLSVASSTFIASNQTTFVLTSGDIGLPSTTTFQWNYECN